MSGSAKAGLMGVLLMIVFVAVVWDRGNEKELERRATEVIVLPEPEVLSGGRVRASVPSGDAGKVEEPAGERPVRLAENPAPKEVEADRARLDHLAKTLFPSPPPRVEIAVEPERKPVGEEYTVREGDTLWVIAARVYGDGTRWGRIHRANLGRIANPDRLVAGTRLVIPAPGGAAPDAAREEFYVVRKGDTLYGISRATLGSGKHWERILAANRGRIRDPDRLEPGTRLVIPASKKPGGGSR